ncbi:MAG: hypothetical protein AB1393_03610 [Candidatus Edwardsbacteria bacterium]
MKVKYNRTIYYSLVCLKCGSETQIDNEYGKDLTGTKIDCENCGEKLEITNYGETIYK